MTLKDILLKTLTEEQATEILDAMKEAKIYTASEENLDTRYGKLKTEHESLVSKEKEARDLIAQLQSATKEQEDVQSKIQAYEDAIKEKDAELLKTKTESALKLGLLDAGAKSSDIDYLMFKIAAGEWKAELDDNGSIKGLDDQITSMKTTYPSQFSTADGGKKIEEHKLQKGSASTDTITKEQFQRMGLQSRVELKQNNPELYAQLTK